MANESIKLNLIPAGDMPVFHCSQFDNGRLIIIELYNGEDAYELPEGYTAELHCRKVDNNIVTLASTLVNTNVVTFTSTTQLCACNGKNLCEVAIKDASDFLIGTLNFWLEVEMDPIKGGINSTSEIHDLYEQIEEITAEVIGDDYYDKTEVDNLLDDKADKSTTYTKTQVDTLLTSKADKSNVYTKSETNTLLADKADADDVYTKAQVETKLAAKADAADVYTKDETDTLLDAKANANAVYSKVEVDGIVDDLEDAIDLKADAATTYTKTEVDSALALKANAADVYTKTQVDNIILDIMPVDTAGPASIASFDTDLAVNLVDVKTTLTPSLTGYTALNLQNCNNAFVPLWSIDNTFRGTVAFNQLANSYVNNQSTVVENADGTLTVTSSGNTYFFGVELKAAENAQLKTKTDHKYYFYTSVISSSIENLNRFNLGNWNNEAVILSQTTGELSSIVKSKNDTAGTYFNVSTIGTSLNTDTFTCKKPILIDLTQMFGSTIADYIYSLEQNESGAGVAFFRSMYPNEYYNYNTGTTELIGTNLASIALGDTYYGGTLDVTTGTLTVEYDSSLQPITPYDVQLTPVQIAAIVGQNNVFSDTGDTTVKYKEGIQHYIDKKVST